MFTCKRDLCKFWYIIHMCGAFVFLKFVLFASYLWSPDIFIFRIVSDAAHTILSLYILILLFLKNISGSSETKTFLPWCISEPWECIQGMVFSMIGWIGLVLQLLLETWKFSLFSLYQALGMPQEAIACYQHALQTRPNYGMAYGGFCCFISLSVYC